MIGLKRTLASAFVALVLVATAATSMWLMASAGVFTGAEQPLPSAPEVSVTAAAVEEGSGTTAAIAAGFQAAQPRNPFEPLIDADDSGAPPTTIDDESSTTTSTDPGETTSTTTDGTTSSTTTTLGDDPDGTRVVLLEVREENDELVAVVEVDGETHTVGVGDTFAENFKVVSLTETGGVFTFGDSAFTLSVGQSITK